MEPTTPYRRRLIVTSDSAIPGGALNDGSITSNKLADAAVTAAKLAASAVITAKINDLAVTTAKIADANVTTAKIADANVTTAKIADANVTTAKINDGAVTLAKLDPGVEAEAEVILSAAQVLALNSTPITVVAAPSAGNFIDLINVQLYLAYNSVAYTVGATDDLQVKYTDASGPSATAAVETTGFLNATSNQVRVVQPAGTVTPVAAAALVLHCLNANPGGGGNSQLKVRVRYRVRAFTW